jgi:hypothetical protein
MILSDFEPCFQVSAHTYRYNAALSHVRLFRGEAALPLAKEEGAKAAAGRVLGEGPWEVFAHDSRLPGSGWAYLESRVRLLSCAVSVCCVCAVRALVISHPTNCRKHPTRRTNPSASRWKASTLIRASTSRSPPATRPRTHSRKRTTPTTAITLLTRVMRRVFG